MSKRKRVVLSLKDKINIIEALKKGESGRNLADKYGVGTSTISDIKKNTDSIVLYTCKLDSEEGSKHRKMMNKPKNELLEDALYCWILKKRSAGQPISGPLLCEKALQLNKKIGGNESFMASNGWLHRFKSRHGIRELEIHGEKMTANVDAANSFKDDLKNITDETGLNWKSKSLPSKSLAPNRENSAPGYKTSKDRVTILICAKATGTFKIPLLNEENLDVDNDAIPSHDEAFYALETALKWFEKQTESDTVSLLQLKRIRDIAAMKKRCGLRQMTITKYFKPS